MLGAVARWAVIELVGLGDGFPWAVFAVNVVGCGLLGALLVVARDRPRHRAVAGDLLGIGFCGGFTTMSTFAVELATFARDGRSGMAVLYLTASVVAGVGAAWAGGQVEHRLRGGTTS
jgi:CrcB protein